MQYTVKNLILLLALCVGLLLTSCQSANLPAQLAADSFHIQILASPAVSQVHRLEAKEIRGINYYPQNHPWQKFWLDYPSEQSDTNFVEADLAKIQKLGFNTVRIFVFYDLFGGAHLNPEMKAHLVDFLNRAQTHQLQVIVTLFDQYHLYAPEYRKAARQHLQALTQGLESHPAVLAWDLKNESDLDYAHYGQATVQNWLKAMLQELRTRVQQPITASYANGLNMGPEVGQLDYLTFHYYEREEDFAGTVETLRHRFPQQPLVLGEFGYHTWENRPGDAHPMAHQFNYYNAILAQVQKEKLAGFLTWTLYDFPLTLNEIPFLQGESYNHHLGLFDLNGQAKPGLLAIQQRAHIIDAQSGGAVTPETQRLEMVLQCENGQNDRLQWVQGPERKTLWTSQTAVGTQTVELNLNTSQIQSLLHLESKLVLNTEQSDNSRGQTLLLRRD